MGVASDTAPIACHDDATEDMPLMIQTFHLRRFFGGVTEALSEAIERVESKLAERRAIRERKKTLHLFLSVAHSVDKIEMLLVLPPMGGPFALQACLGLPCVSRSLCVCVCGFGSARRGCWIFRC